MFVGAGRADASPPRGPGGFKMRDQNQNHPTFELKSAEGRKTKTENKTQFKSQKKRIGVKSEEFEKCSIEIEYREPDNQLLNWRPFGGRRKPKGAPSIERKTSTHTNHPHLLTVPSAAQLKTKSPCRVTPYLLLVKLLPLVGSKIYNETSLLGRRAFLYSCILLELYYYRKKIKTSHNQLIVTPKSSALRQ